MLIKSVYADFMVKFFCQRMLERLAWSGVVITRFNRDFFIIRNTIIVTVRNVIWVATLVLTTAVAVTAFDYSAEIKVIQLDGTIHLVVREALTRMAILVVILTCESNWLVAVRPNNNGEIVRNKVVFIPKSLDLQIQFLASFHIKRISVESLIFKAHPVHSTVSDPEIGILGVWIAVAITKVLAVVAVRTDIDILIHGGFKRNNLMERHKCSFEVKKGFVSELLSLHIWIGWCEPKLLMEVFGIHEKYAIISWGPASLFSELFCPFRTCVTPVAMIALWTPRVP